MGCKQCQRNRERSLEKRRQLQEEKVARLTQRNQFRYDWAEVTFIASAGGICPTPT